MIYFCINCGPAFLISIIGYKIFHNVKIGIILFICQLLSSIIIALFFSFTFEKNIEEAYEQNRINIAENIVLSVNSAISSLISICGFILLFSAIISILKSINLPIHILGIIEVTTGCNLLEGSSSISAIMLANIFTSFGGLCVFFQIKAIFKGARFFKIILAKIANAIISTIILKIIYLFFPQTLACSLSISSYEVFSVSPFATICTLFFGIMLLFFSRNSDKI